MTNNSGESFDFSAPYSNTVEVQPVDVAPTGFAQKFESAKQQESNYQSEKTDEDPEIIKKYTKNIQKTTTKKAGFGQWLVMFLLLVCLCSVSTFAVINYKDNQQKLADVEREQSVAGARTNGSTIISTPLFSVATAESLPTTFVVLENKTEFLTGFERSFFKASILVTQASGGESQKSGIEVIAQENTVGMTSVALVDLLKKTMLESAYTYPALWDSTTNAKNILKPINAGDPTVFVTQTKDQLYIVRQFLQIPKYSKQTSDLVGSLKLN